MLNSLKDLYWLAGLLEGEGSFMHGPPSKPNSPIISVDMTDEDVIARVSEIFKRKYHPVKRRDKKHKESYAVRLTGKKAVSLMMMLYPLMGNRRREKITAVLSRYDYEAEEINRKRQADNNRKLAGTDIEWALLNKDKLSLRERARHLKVHHETLRRVLKIR